MSKQSHYMLTTSPHTAMLMALSFLKGVGPVALRKAATIPFSDALNIEKIALEIPSVAKALSTDFAWTQALEAAELQLDAAERFDARILSPVDAEYPRLLSMTRDDPFLLYVRGTLAAQQEKSIGIIGTRLPTPNGIRTAQRISEFCIDQGWSVVSGLAIGCDSVAHQTAIDMGGHTVAVLAHGLQMIAPSKNQRLAESILLKGGALISQFPFGQKVFPQQYVIRDRVQAGLSRVVVMVQSDLKGGSLHASRAALEYSRWLAIPYPTQVDIENKEQKIQANLVISDHAANEVGMLLRSDPKSLERLIILHGKGDYAVLASAMSGELLETRRKDESLF